MLRVFVTVAAMVAFTVALVVAAFAPTQWPAVIWTGAVLAGVVFERARYGAARERPADGDWRETPERFIDDASGRVMVVWVSPSSGERRYVLEGDSVNAPTNELQ
ncbi:hypothetical protein PX554_02160 [Sphingomonas sp. H39-1-10]|uniref:hypothetical protein n=1 Tax=Sphingomonas pollutisoli TaxID=3030829 RepID=UPI0023B971D4|nr:hypothetical protein [Sphingomonas pollutisoli]MDF0486919.1 hypothetical protein [Sphingomonas pollutisoli]